MQAESGQVAVGSHPVTSHPLHRVEAQDVEALSHDGGSGVTEQHPPHVDLHHLTWNNQNPIKADEDLRFYQLSIPIS